MPRGRFPETLACLAQTSMEGSHGGPASRRVAWVKPASRDESGDRRQLRRVMAGAPWRVQAGAHPSLPVDPTSPPVGVCF